MTFSKGNEFWKQRTKHGRDQIFKDPELLKEACEEYFEWVHNNPLVEERIFCSKGDICHGKLNKMRAMTIEGMCTFLDISISTWYEWKDKKAYGLSEVVAWAGAIMRNQKLTGAAADMLNASIIARELSLVDSSEVRRIDTIEEPEEIDDDALDALTDEEFEEYERLVAKIKPKGKEDSSSES